MRKSLFPSLQQAYEIWNESGDWRQLTEAASTGRQHWANLANELLELHQQHGPEASAPIKALVEERSL